MCMALAPWLLLLLLLLLLLPVSQSVATGTYGFHALPFLPAHARALMRMVHPHPHIIFSFAAHGSFGGGRGGPISRAAAGTSTEKT